MSGEHPATPRGPASTGAPVVREPSCAERILRFLFRSPGDPGEGPDRGLLDGLLPWPVRVLLVLAAAVVGRLWRDTSIGQQLGWGLHYVALIGVSVGASFWVWILLIELSASLPWWALRFYTRAERPARHCLNHVLTFVNRQIGHIELLAVGLALALSWRPQIEVELPLAVGVLLLAEPLVSWLGRRSRHGEAIKSASDLHWARRPFFYLLTAVGLLLLLAQAPRQGLTLLPLVAAVTLGGLVPRTLRHRRRNRDVREERQLLRDERLRARAEFRRVQTRAARRADFALGPFLVAATALAAVGVSWQARRQHDRREAALEAGLPGDTCTPPAGGPAGRPDAALFLVSDTQLHELGGRRFPGQIELADAFVPVAARPVEQDILSAATLGRFASVYQRLRRSTPAEVPMLWAHLGDLGDLGCAGEIDRVRPVLARFATVGSAAGLAAGNHDSTFTGNFLWSPYWDGACPSGRLGKRASDHRLRDLVAPWVVVGGRPEIVSEGSFSSGGVPGSALVTVSPLARVRHLGRERGLLGIFLDSADDIAFDYGVAGSFGVLSAAQVERIEEMVAAQRAQGGAWADPVYLLFSHHPLAGFTGRSRGRLDALVAALDGGGGGPRVLALLSAHTHHAGTQLQCLGGRRVREIVVGSTADPPQEAAVATLGPDADGVLSLRLRTIPAVARAGKSCGPEPSYAAEECQRVVAALSAEPACRPLFRHETGAPGADCQVLERRLSLGQRLSAVKVSTTPPEPAAILAEQTGRAQRLYACVCRKGACQPPSPALDDAQYAALVARVGATPEGERELTCLSWAAAAVQAHKAGGMTMADALRCAFDDQTLPPAREFVASLEARACR
jgi:hypothetical protein